ncbi:class I SAM-dependent methyltransferase [Thermoactinospora rubra]|uniref:class I SAM-dependent methyltransferase n=1 Tax=Thermoactinospora rubra TaxID=1088767 RepID=UPI000A11BA4D
MWLERWDAQQERYAADREGRFATICHALAHALRNVPESLILDLGCGPGSLSARVARHLPAAEIVAVDMDSLLLVLARAGHPGGVRFAEADLSTPGWSGSLGLSCKRTLPCRPPRCTTCHQRPWRSCMRSCSGGRGLAASSSTTLLVNSRRVGCGP